MKISSRSGSVSRPDVKGVVEGVASGFQLFKTHAGPDNFEICSSQNSSLKLTMHTHLGTRHSGEDCDVHVTVHYCCNVVKM